jgi:hypothetical protein
MKKKEGSKTGIMKKMGKKIIIFARNGCGDDSCHR